MWKNTVLNYPVTFVPGFLVFSSAEWEKTLFTLVFKMAEGGRIPSRGSVVSTSSSVCRLMTEHYLDVLVR